LQEVAELLAEYDEEQDETQRQGKQRVGWGLPAAVQYCYTILELWKRRKDGSEKSDYDNG
jgi:hypothetical protein